MKWTPIIKGNKVKKIERILAHIRESIESNINSTNDLSLNKGIIGSVLFLIWYDFIMNKSNKIDSYFDIINKRLSIENVDASFMFGLSGISWFYYFSANINFVNWDHEFETSLKSIDDLIKPSINLEAAKRNIDLFDGLNGFTVYLIERGKYYNAYQDLYEIVKYYNKISIKDEIGTRWVDRKNYNLIEMQNVSMPEILFGEEINLGLAHGMIGTLIVLSKLYELDIHKVEVKNMLMNSLKWLLKQRNNKSDQVFPYLVTNPKIGWCYGDLSIAYSLAFIGKKLQKKELTKTAVNIALKSSKYTNNNIEINSPYFCHGAAGIAHIYNRLYHLTFEEQFLNQAIYWYNILIETYNSNYKIGGYFDDNDNSFYGIQFGISGIGLVLLSGIYSNDPQWDRCLLLS